MATIRKKGEYQWHVQVRSKPSSIPVLAGESVPA